MTDNSVVSGKKISFNAVLFWSIFGILFLPRGSGFYFGSSLPVLDLPRICMLGLILAWLMKKQQASQQFRIFANIPTRLFLMFIALEFLSVFISSRTLVSLLHWIGFVGYFYGIYFILGDLLESRRDCEKVMRALMFSAVCLGFLSCFELLFNYRVFDNVRTAWKANPLNQFKMSINRGGIHSSYGPYGNPPQFGLFFVSTVFLFLRQYAASFGLKQKAQAFFWGLVIVCGLLATQTRSALFSVGITFFLALLFARQEDRKKLLPLITAVVCCGIVLFVLVIPEGFSYFKFWYFDRFWSNDPSLPTSGLGGRVYAVKAVLPLIAGRPLLGWGMGAFTKSQWIPSPIDVGPDLMIYFGFALESGIIAALLFGLFILFTVFNLYRAYWKETHLETRWLLLSIAMSLVAYSIALVNGTPLDSSFVFFALLALAGKLTGAKKIALTARWKNALKAPEETSACAS